MHGIDLAGEGPIFLIGMLQAGSLSRRRRNSSPVEQDEIAEACALPPFFNSLRMTFLRYRRILAVAARWQPLVVFFEHGLGIVREEHDS